MIKMKNRAIRYFFTFLIYNCFLILLLCLSYSIPREKTLESVTEARDDYEKSGLYQGDYDGWTDALIMSTTIISANNDKVRNLFDLARFALCNNVCREAMTDSDPLLGLNKLIPHEDRFVPYSNYFVGAVFFYRILFVFFTVDTVRFFLQMITVCGIVSVSVLLYKSLGNYRGIIPFMTMVLTGNLIYMSGCLTYAIDILIMLMSIIIVLLLEEKKNDNDWIMIFGLIGMLSFSMNYWSFPLLTLMGPLVALFMVWKSKSVKIKIHFIRISQCIGAWIVGFGLEVGFRVATGRLFCDSNTALEHLRYYSTSDSIFDVGLTRVQRVKICWDNFFTLRNRTILLLSIVILLPGLLMHLIKSKKKKSKIFEIIVGLLLAIIPLVWLFILYNHTFHGFDKFNVCIVTYGICAALVIFSSDYSVESAK